MAEKKFETVSDLIIDNYLDYQELKKNGCLNYINSNCYIINDNLVDLLDLQFINKDKIKFKLEFIVNFIKEYNKQTMLGPAMIDKNDWSLPIKGMTKDEQKGYVDAVKMMLRLLKE